MTELLAAIDAAPERTPREFEPDWVLSVLPLVEGLAEASDTELEAIREAQNEDRAWGLLDWAFLAAVLAVRRSEPRLIVAGLGALSLVDHGEADWRDCVVTDVLLSRSAHHLGMDHVRAHADAAGLSDPAGRVWLSARAEEPVRFDEMTMREEGEGETFNYVSTRESLTDEELAAVRAMLEGDSKP